MATCTSVTVCVFWRWRWRLRLHLHLQRFRFAYVSKARMSRLELSVFESTVCWVILYCKVTDNTLRMLSCVLLVLTFPLRILTSTSYNSPHSEYFYVYALSICRTLEYFDLCTLRANRSLIASTSVLLVLALPTSIYAWIVSMLTTRSVPSERVHSREPRVLTLLSVALGIFDLCRYTPWKATTGLT